MTFERSLYAALRSGKFLRTVIVWGVVIAFFVALWCAL